MTGAAILSLVLGAGRAEASWSAPSAFSTPGESVNAPDVAANTTGGAAIAWSDQINAYTSSIEVSVRQDDGAFSAPQTISAPGTGLNVSPSVAVGEDGTVAVLWSQEGSTAVVSFGSVAGGAFSMPVALEPTSNAYGSQYPHVSIDTAGDVFAAWTDEINVATDGGTAGNTVIHYRSRPAGATSFGPVATLTSPTGQMDYPTFASAPSGATIVTWSGAYAAVRPAGGQFGPAEQLGTDCGPTGPDPAAIDSAGDAVVAWDSTTDCDSGTPVTVLASYMPAGGSFDPAETVAQMGGSSEVAGAVMDPSGEPTIAVAGTLQSPTDNEGLTVLTRSSQGTWGSPQVLFDTDGAANPPLSDDLDSASLAYDSSGDLYAAWNAHAWTSDETIDSGVYAEVQPAGGSFDASPVGVEQTDGALDGTPVLAGAGDGGALLAWTTGSAGHYADFGPGDSGSGGSGGDGATGGGGSAGGSGVGSAGGGQASPVGGNPSASLTGGADPTTSTSTATPAAPTTTPSTSLHVAATRSRTIIIRGRARARAVLVRVLAGRRVIAQRRVSDERGRYRAVLRVPGAAARRLKVEIIVITAHGRTTQSRLIRT